MNTATINQAQSKTPRRPVADAFTMIRDFAKALYAAHGGWLVTDAAQPASGALARQRTVTDRVIVGPFCASALMADMDRASKK